MFLTAKLLRRPFYLWRSVAASAFGALYACAALFLEVSGIWAFLADCGVCLLMCIIGFFEGAAWRRVLLSFLIYFGVSFAVGGVMSGMAALISHLELPLGQSTGSLSAGGFFLLALGGGGATFLWARFCQRRAQGKRVKLILFFGGRQISIRGMVDTANLLRDPIGGKPVALLDMQTAELLFPKSVLRLAADGGYQAMAELPDELMGRVRLIPAKTATGKGLLLALSPDRVLLDCGKGACEVELLVAPVSLAADTDDYAALLPAEVVTE